MKFPLVTALLLCYTCSLMHAAPQNVQSIAGRDERSPGDGVTGQQSPPSPSALSLATNFVTIGYNLLKGNPDGDFTRGGTDPGLHVTRHVMKFTYDENRRVFYNGRSHIVPDQVTFQSVSSCSSRESTTAFSGTRSYQRKLDASVTTEGSGSYGLASFGYSLSAGFSSAKRESKQSRKVITDEEVICNVGTARYRLENALNNHYSISNDFYYAVKNLPTAYVADTYKRFIDEWGTHFIKSVTLGGRKIRRFTSSYNQVYSFARNEYQSATSAGGSYLGFSSSFSVDITRLSRRESFTSRFASSLYTIASGLQIEERNGHYYTSNPQTRAPVPIRISLVTIDTALDSRLWTHLPETGTSYSTLQINLKKSSLQRALRAYPALTNAQRGSDPAIRFPNAWPDGTYSLPKPRSGCPAHGDQFAQWYDGWRYQDTEDDDYNANRFSGGHHLAGSFGRNIQTHWCSKTVSSGDYGISWPKGSYCIGRKNGRCPGGFSEGNIRWDDEDSNNANRHGGILPDGSYDRNTRIYYCCRNDAHPTNVISLPTDRPFYLMRKHHDGCQLVRNMRVQAEWVYWDDEDDDGNIDSESGSYPYRGGSNDRNHQLNYCYYYQ